MTKNGQKTLWHMQYRNDYVVMLARANESSFGKGYLSPSSSGSELCVPRTLITTPMTCRLLVECALTGYLELEHFRALCT